MSRIKGSDSDLGSLFNIEIDPRRPSALTRMAAKVSKWSPRTTLAVLGGSVTGARDERRTARIDLDSEDGSKIRIAAIELAHVSSVPQIETSTRRSTWPQ